MGFDADGPERRPGRRARRPRRCSEAVAARYDVVLTTGGTGISPTDRTPEMTRALSSTTRSRASPRPSAPRVPAKVPTAALSRGIAGVAGRTLIVNLPGSAGGVRTGSPCSTRLLVHAVDQIHGGDHPRGVPQLNASLADRR